MRIKRFSCPKYGIKIFDRDRKDRKKDAIEKKGYLLFDLDPVL